MSKRSQEHMLEFHDNTNSAGDVAPSFIGPVIADQTDETNLPLDTSGLFSAGNGVAPTYSAVLPAGLAIDPGTGIITGTGTTPSVTIATVYLKTSNGVVHSNSFSWTIT